MWKKLKRRTALMLALIMTMSALFGPIGSVAASWDVYIPEFYGETQEEMVYEQDAPVDFKNPIQGKKATKIIHNSHQKAKKGPGNRKSFKANPGQFG